VRWVGERSWSSMTGSKSAEVYFSKPGLTSRQRLAMLVDTALCRLHKSVLLKYSGIDSLPIRLPILGTNPSPPCTPNWKQTLSRTSRSTLKTLLLSPSRTFPSIAAGSRVPPFLTSCGYRIEYDWRMISRGFLSVSWSFDETYRTERDTSC
jgi:hypothetical protein